MATTKTRKQLSFDDIIDIEQVSERYTVYTVLGSKGDHYRVTALEGRVTGCDCKATGECYHRRGITSYIAFEAAWNAPIEQVDESPAPAEEQTAPAMTVAEFALGKMTEDLDQHLADEEGMFAREADEIIASEKRKNAPLNGRGRKIEMGPCGPVLMAS